MRRNAVLRDEHGQTIVLFSVLLPIIVLLTSLAWDAGNWWIHRRHLQTQADAAVLATVNDFSGCFFDASAVDTQIATDALKYAGDTTRNSTTANQQIENPPGSDNVHVVLNSNTYWQISDGTTLNASGYVNHQDWTSNAPNGKPCESSTIEAKATDDRVRPLVPWLPLIGSTPFPSPHRHARLSIFQSKGESGMLPIAIPEIDPAAVFAIFVDYSKDGTQTPIAYQQLTKDTSGVSCGSASFPYACWYTSAGQGAVSIQTNGASEGTGVVILVSKNSTSPSMAGTLNQICGQSANLVACYAGTGSGYDGGRTGQGLSFIHSYRDNNGSPTDPRLRDVSLTSVTCNDAGDLSAPYFTNDVDDCTATLTVKVDFGVNTDPTNTPQQGGVCAQLTSNYGDLKLQSRSGNISTWVPTNWTIPLPFSTGSANKLRLTWTDVTDNPADPGVKNNCTTGGNPPPNIRHGPTDFPYPAAVPYVSDDAAGPVDSLKLSATGPLGSQPTCPSGTPVPSGDANTLSGGGNTPWYCYGVAVGLDKPITLRSWDSPDILLRTGSKAARQTGNDQTSLNGALDCDHGRTLTDEFKTGCFTLYNRNYYDWDNNPATPDTWYDITCQQNQPGEYSGQLPPLSYTNNPAPICVAPKSGQVQDLEKAIYARWENPCTPNRWPSPGSSPAVVDAFFKSLQSSSDPRLVTFLITDQSAFQSPSQDEPIKYYAGFYVTGWWLTNGGGAQSLNGCFGFQNNPKCGSPNNDAHPIYGCPGNGNSYSSGAKFTRAYGDIWGHWVQVVNPPSQGDPGNTKCNLLIGSPATCQAVLTE